MRRSPGLFVALGFIAAAIAFGYYALERVGREARTERAVAAHADEVFRSPTSVVAGYPDGDVSIVAFFVTNSMWATPRGTGW